MLFPFSKFLVFSNTSALHFIDSLQKPLISAPWWFILVQDFRTLSVSSLRKLFISALCYTASLWRRLRNFLDWVLSFVDA
jgi:hypothetical protein